MTSARLDKAMAKLQRLASDNAPLGARISAEIEYGQAYQELVRAGSARQIRRKYRGGS
jgi:hypothetical protein